LREDLEGPLSSQYEKSIDDTSCCGVRYATSRHTGLLSNLAHTPHPTVACPHAKVCSEHRLQLVTDSIPAAARFCLRLRCDLLTMAKLTVVVAMAMMGWRHARLKQTMTGAQLTIVLLHRMLVPCLPLKEESTSMFAATPTDSALASPAGPRWPLLSGPARAACLRARLPRFFGLHRVAKPFQPLLSQVLGGQKESSAAQALKKLGAHALVQPSKPFCH
jgi:hypothetical protein